MSKVSRRLWWAVPILIMVALAIGSLGIGRPWSVSRALVAPDVQTGNVQTLLKVGEVGYFGFGTLGARGSRPIQIESAEILGAPDGMKVDGPYFYRWREARPLGASKRIRPFLRPLDSVVFDPPSEEKRWTLMVGVHVTRPGSYRTKGLRVCYRVDGRRGCSTYQYVIGIDIETDSGS